MSEHFTILLVEDSTLMRKLVRDMLSNMGGYTVLEAGDGAEALEVLRARRVDMVLSDWNMRPMDGLHLFHAVRTEPSWAALPFVMMTGEQTPHTITQAVAGGSVST